MTKTIWFRFTKCDSGNWLNPLMHLFLIITTAFAVALLFFGDTTTVQAVVLYQQSDYIFGINQFGLVAGTAMVAHSLAFWFRKKVGLVCMPIAMACGFYAWLYATVLYLDGGFYFQFIVACVPNLLFWSWYAWQFNRRRRGEINAFVH